MQHEQETAPGLLALPDLACQTLLDILVQRGSTALTELVKTCRGTRDMVLAYVPEATYTVSSGSLTRHKSLHSVASRSFGLVLNLVLGDEGGEEWSSGPDLDQQVKNLEDILREAALQGTGDSTGWRAVKQLHVAVSAMCCACHLLPACHHLPVKLDCSHHCAVLWSLSALVITTAGERGTQGLHPRMDTPFGCSLPQNELSCTQWVQHQPLHPHQPCSLQEPDQAAPGLRFPAMHGAARSAGPAAGCSLTQHD